MVFAVLATNTDDAVTSVLEIDMVHNDVLSNADNVTSVTRLCVAVDEIAIPRLVLPTKTAVAVRNGTSIKNHAVPSFAIAQSELAVPVIGKNRLVATAVLGVLVAYLNVTVLVAPIDHEPVKVPIRNTLALLLGVG